MALERIIVLGYSCKRCPHQWVPKDRAVVPMVCPKCKSPYWNKSKKKKGKAT